MDFKKGLPNIIYILADDLGYGDISYLNESSQIKTNNIDLIGREGIAFTDAHSSSAVCTPSRYSILTGRYNWRSKLKSRVLLGYDKHLIEDGRMTVASMLKREGYQTACIGKWHLGMDWAQKGDNPEDIDYTQPIKNGPLAFGFDYFYGISASLDMPPYVYIENDMATQVPNRITKSEKKMASWREGPIAADFNHQEVLPKLTEKVLSCIEEYSTSPFFIYFPLPAPHNPVLPSKEFQGKSGTNSYGDFVLMCDDVVGQVMKKLEATNLKDNTILIFTSDNGCSPVADYQELAQYGHNPSYIFRGHKADIFEGGHRIPLLISWPEKMAGGIFSNEPLCLVDLMATIAAILDYDLPDNAAEDSVSNLPLWLGEDFPKPLREAIVHHSYNGSFSIRKGKWKLELCPGSGGWSYPKPGKETEGKPPIQLYDLSLDIGEKTNVYAQYPQVVEELTNLMKKYVQEGRSTQGQIQKNTGPHWWPQLKWMN